MISHFYHVLDTRNLNLGVFFVTLPPLKRHYILLNYAIGVHLSMSFFSTFQKTAAAWCRTKMDECCCELEYNMHRIRYIVPIEIADSHIIMHTSTTAAPHSWNMCFQDFADQQPFFLYLFAYYVSTYDSACSPARLHLLNEIYNENPTLFKGFRNHFTGTSNQATETVILSFLLTILIRAKDQKPSRFVLQAPTYYSRRKLPFYN